MSYAGPTDSDHENTNLRRLVYKEAPVDSYHPLSYVLWRIWRVSEACTIGGLSSGSDLECADFFDIADALLTG